MFIIQDTIHTYPICISTCWNITRSIGNSYES